MTEEDVEHLIIGVTILGTGGGGNPEKGLSMLKNDLERGRRLAVASPSEVPNDALIVCPYFCGSIAPSKKSKTLVFEDPMSIAFERMEKYLGKKVFAPVATELGGVNTAIPLHVASMMGLPLLDGDYVGRAAPELLQSSANIFGVSMLPSVAVSESGNVTIVERYASLDEYEGIVRSLSVVAGGFVAVVDTAVDGDTAKKILIKGTVSTSMEVGKTVKEANAAGKDAVAELATCLNGSLLFRGVVKKYEWEDRGGFLYGEAAYDGTEEWKGHQLKIWIKNENIVAWKDGQVAVTAPDLICVTDEKGYGITNSELKEGMKSAVIAAKAPDVWLTPKGIELFGPKHFGFPFDYLPMKNEPRFHTGKSFTERRGENRQPNAMAAVGE